jgi:septal ring factor EnvC (AmiA/AmiB activator)
MRDRPVPDDNRPRSRRAIGRSWVAVGALAVLLLVTVFLSLRLAESESQAERLRAELRSVYAEAESLRTAAEQSQRRVVLLEQQVRQLRNEREAILKQLRAPASRPR